MDRSTLKIVGAVLLAAIAIALAVFSAWRSLRPQGQAVGDLGYLGSEREEALKTAPKAAPQGERR
jgi:hypothetical protein